MRPNRSALARLSEPDAAPLEKTALRAQPTSEEAIQLAAEISQSWERFQTAIAMGDKDSIRAFHLSAKTFDREIDYAELRTHLARYRTYFPCSSSIDPSKISPVLLPVTPRSLEERLFKVMRGYWSMPYSKGYGRRMRFVVMDSYHNAVIGIIGLQSPSADLACRDQYLGAVGKNKLDLINSTLDAYTVGASPVYAPLLAGKLVAGLLHSVQIRQQYWKIYGSRSTLMLDRRLHQPLLAITTASAFGRSSIYNRLRYKERLLAKPIGFTRGFGTIHLEELYPRIYEWLKANGRNVPPGFGNGPKVRWQNIMRALGDLNISRTLLEHGLKREVYIFELADNLSDVFRLGAAPGMLDFNDEDWSEYWKSRWAIPRASSIETAVDGYQAIDAALRGALGC